MVEILHFKFYWMGWWGQSEI